MGVVKVRLKSISGVELTYPKEVVRKSPDLKNWGCVRVGFNQENCVKDE